MSAQSSLPLTGQTAIVTGSSSGIGRAIALELARAGADVLVHARRSLSAAEATAAEITALGRESRVILADVSLPGEQDGLLDEAWRWRGRINILVNNAGADVLTGPAAAMTFDEKLSLLWQTDVVSTIRIAREAGARMRKAGSGTILNIGWDHAEYGMAGSSGELFAATKGAIMAFSRSLAQSLAPEVRVNCLAPGWIRTAWAEGASVAWQQRARRESLVERWGTPDDVAHAAGFLCSPDAAFITGQVWPINGGFRIG